MLRLILLTIFGAFWAIAPQAYAQSTAQSRAPAIVPAQPQTQDVLNKWQSQKLEINNREVLYYEARELYGRPLPLVIMLHGGFSSNNTFSRHFPFFEVAMTRGLNVVYIEGTPMAFTRNRRVWNAGKCCGSAMKDNIDDVSFISDVIKHFSALPNIDANNIFLVGSSNGAMMSYRFACERPDEVTGIFPMGGFFANESCLTLGKVKVYHIHGDKDDTVPLQGGGKGRVLMGEDFPPISDTEARLQQAQAAYVIDIVKGGGHNVTELDAALKKSRDTDLSTLIADMIEKMKR